MNEKQWEINLDTITSYEIALKYKWPAWWELSRTKRFDSFELALSEAEKIKAKILKQGWLDFNYADWKLKYRFAFMNCINDLCINEIEASEKFTNASALLMPV